MFRVGYGYLMKGGYRTILAYSAPGHKKRIPFYSSPVFKNIFLPSSNQPMAFFLQKTLFTDSNGTHFRVGDENTDNRMVMIKNR